MPKHQTVYYLADPPDGVTGGGTQFWWADHDNDQFDRDLDLYRLALALERHDHRAGRGKPVGRIDAGSIDAAGLGPNSVPTTALQDGAVTTAKLADNAVTSVKILNGTIKGEDMEPTAIVDRLGYTPVNKAGDTGLGSMAFADGSDITFSGPGPGSTFGGVGAITLHHPYTAATFSSDTAALPSLVAWNSAPNGLGFRVVNQANNGSDLALTHTQALFAPTIEVQGKFFYSLVPPGTAPFHANSTTICPNLNASLLGGYSAAYFGRATHEVPQGAHALFQTAANIPGSGWVRQTNLNGRLLVGAGAASGVPGAINFVENGLAGGSWNVAAATHTHPIAGHSHFMGHSPNLVPSGTFSAGTHVALARDAGKDTYPYPGSGDGATEANPDASSAWNFPTYGMVLAYKN